MSKELQGVSYADNLKRSEEIRTREKGWVRG